MKQLDNPPSWLDRCGKDYWRKLAPALTRDGILNEATAELIAMACQSYSNYRKAHEQLTKEGRVITTTTGTVKVHPLLTVERAAFEQVVKVWKELNIAKKPETPEAIDLEEFD